MLIVKYHDSQEWKAIEKMFEKRVKTAVEESERRLKLVNDALIKQTKVEYQKKMNEMYISLVADPNNLNSSHLSHVSQTALLKTASLVSFSGPPTVAQHPQEE